MAPVIVIRPQPGCDATLAVAHEMGLEAYGFPLFEIHALNWNPPNPSSFDALLIGSANVLRHGGAALAAYRGKPAYAVGQSTANAADAAGLDVVASGKGGLQTLFSLLRPDHRHLLRLAGQEHVALEPPPGISMTERLVYRSEPQPMPSGLVGLLNQLAIVLLHSAEAARHFASQVDQCGLSRGQIHIAGLGPRIIEAAGEGWNSNVASPTPDDKGLLALAQQLCQTDANSNS